MCGDPWLPNDLYIIEQNKYKSNTKANSSKQRRLGTLNTARHSSMIDYNLSFLPCSTRYNSCTSNKYPPPHLPQDIHTWRKIFLEYTLPPMESFYISILYNHHHMLKHLINLILNRSSFVSFTCIFNQIRKSNVILFSLALIYSFVDNNANVNLTNSAKNNAYSFFSYLIRVAIISKLYLIGN